MGKDKLKFDMKMFSDALKEGHCKDVSQTVMSLKKTTIKELHEGLKDITTYQMQRGGISSSVYDRLLNNPDKMQLETLLKIFEKVEKIKKGS